MKKIPSSCCRKFAKKGKKACGDCPLRRLAAGTRKQLMAKATPRGVSR